MCPGRPGGHRLTGGSSSPESRAAQAARRGRPAPPFSVAGARSAVSRLPAGRSRGPRRGSAGAGRRSSRPGRGSSGPAAHVGALLGRPGARARAGARRRESSTGWTSRSFALESGVAVTGARRAWRRRRPTRHRRRGPAVSAPTASTFRRCLCMGYSFRSVPSPARPGRMHTRCDPDLGAAAAPPWVVREEFPDEQVTILRNGTRPRPSTRCGTPQLLHCVAGVRRRRRAILTDQRLVARQQ